MDFMGGVGIEVVGGAIVASLAWLGAKLLKNLFHKEGLAA